MMHFLVYWLPCILFINGGGLSLGLIEDANMRPCIDKERQALLNFKASLNDSSGFLDDWGSEEEKRNCCKWVYVSCSNDFRHVIGLDLSTTEGLAGKISPSLAQLHQLQYLILRKVNFQFNPIPNILGSLSNLRHLDISSASLSGHIPHHLANLSNLLHLNLSHNFLSGSIPFSFGDLTSLTQLDLSGNQLGGIIPKSFENCSSLVELNLSENLLNGSVPSFAGCRTFMKELILHHNSLQGGVPNVTGWSSLNTLSLGHNSLNGNIPDFTGCPSLSTLDLSSNNFTGDLPNRVGQLTNLDYLDVSDNSLNGNIPDFSGCPSMSTLDLSDNNLTGNLPISVGQLLNLEYLDVSSNSLNGVISDLHFQNLTQLTYLDLSFNAFAFELSSLRIPFQLNTIKLQSCKLGPSFPLWIKTQRYFTHLDISSAGISEKLPDWFWDLPSGLKFLNLSSNTIRGMLPNKTPYFIDYTGIDLSSNQLEGEISQLPSKLASLNLSGNKFSGDLTYLCHIDEELTFLDLSDNSFSGSLPDCWLKFQRRLIILNLSNNSLSGEIPSSLGFLSHLQALYLRTNAFVGELPMSLSNCTKLRFVDLGENKLSGFIPEWIGERVTELYVLVLRSNRFYGSLPTQICWLYNLQLLDLSKNGLSGNVPWCFGNFSAMATRRFGDDMTNHSYYTYAGTIIPLIKPSPFSLPQRGRHLRSVPYRYADFSGEALFIDNAWVVWKGTERSFGRSGLQLLKSIDLSSNNFSGKLPYQIGSLFELVSLNFSINKLHGEVPKEMGQLKYLESLDLSRNEFSGHIPWSLSQLNFLSYLNLSENNLSGSIPTGPQLQIFNSSSYNGNPHLCGLPLTQRCGLTPATTATEKEVDEKDADDDLWKSYYMGLGAGFAAGFWGVCGALFLNRRCRHFFFTMLSHVQDWIYVTMAVHFRKLAGFQSAWHS